MVTFSVLILWNAQSVFSAVTLSNQIQPHLFTLWLFGGVVFAYCVWLGLFAGHWISAAGAPGFVIAVLGLQLRYLGDVLLTLPDPIGPFPDSTFRMFTTEQGFDPDHFPAIVNTARYGGLAAFLIGLLIALVFGVVEFRARCRALRRLRGYAIRMPRWF